MNQRPVKTYCGGKPNYVIKAEYCLWPDGTYCERHELEQMAHMSDDYQMIIVSEWDDNGDPMFLGGLR